MLNAEKYKNEILETIDGFENYGVTELNQIIMCEENGCCICQFCKDHFCDNKAKTRWLLSEYKEPVKLTRLEYDILKYISENTKYLYITRDRCNGLFLYDMEPSKGNGYWNGESYAVMTTFNKLFQFVKWEDKESTSIKDVLNNCEVIENA